MFFFEKHYKKIKIKPPVCHFVLGSGFSPVLDQLKQWDRLKYWEERESVSFSEIPELPSTSVGSHAGIYRFFVHKTTGAAISFQCGRLHAYEGHSASVVAKPALEVLEAGTKHFVLTNISGSLKQEHSLGTVIALTDHVNMTGLSPLAGPEKKNSAGENIGPRFPDMTQIYDPRLREPINKELLQLGVRVKQGVYVCFLGPELESPSQIKWLNTSSKGLFDVVGMSTVLEVIALKQAGANIGVFSLVSNPAAGVDPHYQFPPFEDLIKEIEPHVFKILQAFFLYSEKKIQSKKPL